MNTRMSNDSNSNNQPITLRQVTDIGTEVQRRFSRAISVLTRGQATGLCEAVFDMWMLAALQVRCHDVWLKVHPEDEKKEELQKMLTTLQAGSKKYLFDFADKITTVLVTSNSGLIPQVWDPHSDCFSVLIEEKPANPVLLNSPIVFWVKPSKCPKELLSVLTILNGMAGRD